MGDVFVVGIPAVGFATSPGLWKILSLVFIVAFVPMVRRSLRISFTVSHRGVEAVNFFRTCSADWDELERVDDKVVRDLAWIFSNAYLARLRLVIRRRDGTRVIFPVHATISMTEKGMRRVAEALAPRFEAHGVPFVLEHGYAGYRREWDYEPGWFRWRKRKS